MSRNTKIALLVIGALAVICLGLCGVGALLLPRVTENIVSQKPDDMKRVGAEIADYTLPPGYVEVMGLDMFVYKMVALAPETRRGDDMIFMLMNTNAGGASPQQMERQMQQSFQQQFGRSGSQMQVIGQEAVTIRGQPVTLTIAENDASPKLRQALGTFEGKNGLVIVMVMGPAAAWNDTLLREFLSSIQ
ncbi:hypothetical protein FBQ82_03550 [Anaerolineae bacterium CFX7]|nr:hypothetical protein [Anaerolineae bacterium CFX7]